MSGRFQEAFIRIDGHLLTLAQSAAVRVAVSHWLSELQDDAYRASLGSIGDAYRERLTEVEHLLVGGQ